MADPTDPTDTDTDTTDTAKDDPTDTAKDDIDNVDQPGTAAGPRQVSIPLRTLLIGGLVAVLVIGIGVLGWLYADARSELDAHAQQAADHARAEQLAMDYAVNAAEMDYRDLPAWKGRLVAGTAPELGARLTEAADSMEQILAPLQWESSARPLAAVVRSDVGGAYVVDAFVSVLTKTTQAPEGLQSTATYSVTIDSNQDWLITDVGGLDNVIGSR